MNDVLKDITGFILEKVADFFLTMDKRGVSFLACMLILIGIGIITSEPKTNVSAYSTNKVSVAVVKEEVPENGMFGYQPIDPTGKELIDFTISHYDPRLGGVNCGHWVEGVGCTSHLASGDRWQDYIVDGEQKGSVVACPARFPFWTVFVLVSPESVAGRYVCLDRGSKVTDNWLDILHGNEGYTMPYGGIAKGYIEYPP